MKCPKASIFIRIWPLFGHFEIDVANSCFGSGIHMQLFKHTLQMGADGFVVHFQFVGDQFVGMTFGNELEDLLLPRGEARGFRRVFVSLSKGRDQAAGDLTRHRHTPAENIQ